MLESDDECLAALHLQDWLDPIFRNRRLEDARRGQDRFQAGRARHDRVKDRLVQQFIFGFRVAATAGEWRVIGFDDLEEKVVPPALFWQAELALSVEDITLNADEIRLPSGKILAAARASPLGGGIAIKDQAASSSQAGAVTPKQTKREAVKSFIDERYPNGIPAGVTMKDLARMVKKEKNITVSPRTVSRALGRK
jgi:hypothetical protein